MLVKFVFVILFSPFLTVAYCNHDFEKNNKCGCNLEYTCENCAPCEKLKPICKSNNTEFKEFQAENLNDCKNWLLRGYTADLVNSVDGTLAVTLLLSKSRKDIQYEVELRVVDNQYKHSDTISSLMVHSNKVIRIAGQKSNSSSCEPVVSLTFQFLFSGTYQLYVTRSGIGGLYDSVSSVCLSKQFVISSIFKKEFLNDLEPKFLPTYRPQRQELFFMSHFGKFSTGLHPYSTVVKLKSKIDVRLNDCSGSGNEVANYIMNGINGVCCDSYGESVSSMECPCKFEDGFDKISCTLRNVPNGDYCVLVGFYDPRCKQGTLWTKNANSYCLWSYNYTAEGNQTSLVYDVKLQMNSNWTILFMFLCLGVVSVLSLVIILMYKQKCYGKLRHRLYSFTNSSLMTHSSDSSNISWLMRDGYNENACPEVLLLYPRDCRAFMKSMVAFRCLLKQCGCKVYDPWDDEIYDKVVEACESWTYPYITNNNVKIILLLSECSKRFERAFLGNSVLNYKEPQTLDGVFINSLAAIHQYFCNRFDSYQRIFVVQLEGSPSMNFEFITPATVYSIPQNIEYLISDLISCERGTGDLQLSPMAKLPTSSLMESIVEYKYFKSEHSNYLNDILC